MERDDKKLLWFLVIIHLLFFVLAIIYKGIILPDSIDYLYQAENIKTHGIFYAALFDAPINIDYYSKRPPFFGLVLLALKSIISSNYFVLFIQNILSILNFWLIYKISKNYFRISKPALWLGISLLIFPNQLMYANMLMSEIWLQSFLVWAFYGFIKYRETQQWKWIILNQAALVLALLTKPIMVYFWVINLIFLIYLAFAYKKYLIIAFAALLPLTVFVWSNYNKKITGYYHYSSITHVNIKDYNTKYFLFDKYGSDYGDSIISVIDSSVKTKESYAEKCRYILDTCKHILLSDIPAYGKFHAKGMVNFMADPGRYDFVNFFQIPQTDALGMLHYLTKGDMKAFMDFVKTQPALLIFGLLIIMLFNGIFFLSLIIFTFTKNISLWPKLYLLAITGYIWFLTGPIGSARFKVPVYPFIALAAIIVVYKIRKYYSKSKSASR